MPPTDLPAKARTHLERVRADAERVFLTASTTLLTLSRRRQRTVFLRWSSNDSATGPSWSRWPSSPQTLCEVARSELLAWKPCALNSRPVSIGSSRRHNANIPRSAWRARVSKRRCRCSIVAPVDTALTLLRELAKSPQIAPSAAPEAGGPGRRGAGREGRLRSIERERSPLGQSKEPPAQDSTGVRESVYGAIGLRHQTRRLAQRPSTYPPSPKDLPHRHPSTGREPSPIVGAWFCTLPHPIAFVATRSRSRSLPRSHWPPHAAPGSHRSCSTRTPATDRQPPGPC